MTLNSFKFLFGLTADRAGVAEEPVVMRVLFRQIYRVKYFQIQIPASSGGILDSWAQINLSWNTLLLSVFFSTLSFFTCLFSPETDLGSQGNLNLNSVSGTYYQISMNLRLL